MMDKFKTDYFVINDKTFYCILFAWHLLDENICDEILKLMKTKFNCNSKCDFEMEEDCQRCVDYLNEVYLPVIKLINS